MDGKNLGNGSIGAVLGAMDYTRSSDNIAGSFCLDCCSCDSGTMGSFGLYCGSVDRSVLGRSIQSLVLTPIEDFSWIALG